MTQTTPATTSADVRVEQIDRDAAADFLESWEPGPEMTVVKLARAFASHRLASTPDPVNVDALDNARMAKAIDSLTSWLLHRFGPDTPEGNEAAVARKALTAKARHSTPAPVNVDRVAKLRPQYCLEPAPNGDCWRACLATLTGLPAEIMPNFMHLGTATGEESTHVARDWLSPYGLTIFSHWVEGTWPLEKVLKELGEGNPGVAVIVSGYSSVVNDHHAVIARDGEIIHDPSGVGLTGPGECMCGQPGCTFLHWSVEVVCPLDPAALATPAPVNVDQLREARQKVAARIENDLSDQLRAQKASEVLAGEWDHRYPETRAALASMKGPEA